MTITYKKELYSVPIEIVKSQKKRIILSKEVKQLIGIISDNILDIQVIKTYK